MPSLLLPLLPWAVAGMLAAALNALFRVAVAPLFIQPVFDAVLVQGDLSALPGVLAVGAGVVLAGSAALWAQDAWLGRAAAVVAARWREGLYRGLLARQPGSLPSSGGLAGRILTDLKEVEVYLQFGLGSLVAETLTLVGILLVLFIMNPSATLYLLLMAVPIAVSLWLAGRRVEGSANEAQENTERVSAHLQEGLKQLEVARAFGLQDFLLKRLRPANDATLRAQARRARWAGLQTPLAQVLGFAAIGALLVVLAGSVSAGSMTLGEVTAFVTLLALIATPAQLLPKAYALLQGARAARARLQALRGPPAAEEVSRELVSTPSLSPSVALEDLSFAYDGQPLLQRVSTSWQGNMLVAIIGPSGAGKSTLLRLLLRFLTPSSGRILVSGLPLEAYDEATLRQVIAYVPQDTALFRASLRDNLLLGRRYDEARLWEALRAVKLEEVVRELPAGLNYELREDGAGFSGGQKGRLAVARALLSAPSVLLLDEPSANLDEESERVLVETLLEQARSRLVIVVAHRPALVKAAHEAYELTPAGRLELLREALR